MEIQTVSFDSSAFSGRMVDGVFYLPDPSPQVLAERVERAEEQAEEVLIQDNLKRIREEEENAQLDQEQLSDVCSFWKLCDV